MTVLLISTYDLGRQPFGLASPAAWLRAAGAVVTSVDLSRTPLEEGAVRVADLVAFYLPMHTATRLALPAIARVRAWNPSAHLCCYGLYAPLNAAFLRSRGVETVLGGEFEADLVALATEIARRKDRLPPQTPYVAPAAVGGETGRSLPRLRFQVPDRDELPPLSAYASLQLGNGERKVVGYTEASRGCRHLCRHCPVVPVYNGQFRIVQPDVVLADIRTQVGQGARHITFGDPDFFNGVGHALRIVDAFAREFTDVTYDVTIKIEHLLRHARHLQRLRDTGCAFITSAVESIDDEVLARLEKGHTRKDFVRAVDVCREVGVTLAPTFVAFHPWINLQGYCDLLTTIADLDLVDQVAPVQLGIRLLIPEGSRLLELAEVRDFVEPFDSATLAYPWRHADRRVDGLQREVARLVARGPNAPRCELFEAVRALAHARAGIPRLDQAVSGRPARNRSTVPYLNEPWYC